MSTAWDKAKNLAEKHQNPGGIHVRLQYDGDKVVGMFAGEPHEGVELSRYALDPARVEAAIAASLRR